jgi:hypothetical protein
MEQEGMKFRPQKNDDIIMITEAVMNERKN